MKRYMVILTALLARSLVFGQGGLVPAEILKPLGDQWTTYSGDYSGKRYSLLKLINQSTVKNLSLGWVSRFNTSCGPNGAGEPGVGVIAGGLGRGDLNSCGPARLGGGI